MTIRTNRRILNERESYRNATIGVWYSAMTARWVVYGIFPVRFTNNLSKINDTLFLVEVGELIDPNGPDVGV